MVLASSLFESLCSHCNLFWLLTTFGSIMFGRECSLTCKWPVRPLSYIDKICPCCHFNWMCHIYGLSLNSMNSCLWILGPYWMIIDYWWKTQQHGWTRDYELSIRKGVEVVCGFMIQIISPIIRFHYTSISMQWFRQHTSISMN